MEAVPSISSLLDSCLTRFPCLPAVTPQLRNLIIAAQDPPRFVARGDSWFAFKEAVAIPPFKPSNLAEAIQELGYSVDIVAANALTAAEMSTGRNLANLRAELISSGADALLFSGGGDDLFQSWQAHCDVGQRSRFAPLKARPGALILTPMGHGRMAPYSEISRT
jgi:hypothetical protein